MPTRAELNEAYLNCRKTSVKIARQLIDDHGGNGSLDSVPQDRISDLLAAFQSETGAKPTPTNFSDLYRPAFARFNNPPRRRT